LFRVRSMLAPALVLSLERPPRDADWAEQIATSLCQPHVLQALERLTSTRPRLRVSFPKEGHQRSLLWAISELVAAKTDRVLVNPKAALWEVQIERGREPRLYLVPKRYEDPRFTYRMREISGASHPSIAAALVDVLDVRESDVIWDPFVGSGLELVECGLRGKYRELIGTDNNPRALEAAQANVDAAGLSRVRLLNADARSAKLSHVTGIVTNPPLGIRHQRDGLLEPLLMEFLANARHNLAPGGRLVWLSPLPQKTAERARGLGFDVTRRGPVDVGGLTPELQILRVPNLTREVDGRQHTMSGNRIDSSTREGSAAPPQVDGALPQVDGALPQRRRRVIDVRPQSDTDPSGDSKRRSATRRRRS
ncbi:MAG: TRM11 family SAM-dependent methyltransferase, partial [Myxococcales bacterium]